MGYNVTGRQWYDGSDRLTFSFEGVGSDSDKGFQVTVNRETFSVSISHREGGVTPEEIEKAITDNFSSHIAGSIRGHRDEFLRQKGEVGEAIGGFFSGGWRRYTASEAHTDAETAYTDFLTGRNTGPGADIFRGLSATALFPTVQGLERQANRSPARTVEPKPEEGNEIVVERSREDAAAERTAAERREEPAEPAARASTPAAPAAADTSNPGAAENSNGSRAGNYGVITKDPIRPGDDGEISHQTANMQGALAMLGLYDYSLGNNNIDGRDGEGTKIAAQAYADKYMEPHPEGKNYTLLEIAAHMSEQLKDPSSQPSIDIQDRLNTVMQVVENDVLDSTEQSRRAAQGALNMMGDHNLVIDGKIGTNTYAAHSAEVTEFTNRPQPEPAPQEPEQTAPPPAPTPAPSANELLAGIPLNMGHVSLQDGNLSHGVSDKSTSRDDVMALARAMRDGRDGVISIGRDNQIYLTTEVDGEASRVRITGLMRDQGVVALGLAGLQLDSHGKDIESAQHIMAVKKGNPNFDAETGFIVKLKDNGNYNEVWVREENGRTVASLVGDGRGNALQQADPAAYAAAIAQSDAALLSGQHDLRDYKDQDATRNIFNDYPPLMITPAAQVQQVAAQVAPQQPPPAPASGEQAAVNTGGIDQTSFVLQSAAVVEDNEQTNPFNDPVRSLAILSGFDPSKIDDPQNEAILEAAQQEYDNAEKVGILNELLDAMAAERRANPYSGEPIGPEDAGATATATTGDKTLAVVFGEAGAVLQQAVVTNALTDEQLTAYRSRTQAEALQGQAANGVDPSKVNPVSEPFEGQRAVQAAPGTTTGQGFEGPVSRRIDDFSDVVDKKVEADGPQFITT